MNIEGGLLIMILALSSLVTGMPAHAQSQADLGKRYPVVPAYLVRPGIVAFVQFDQSGLVCQMTVEKKEGVESPSGHGEMLSGQVADEIIDELAPPRLRGKSLSPYLSADSYVAGGSFLLREDFENASVEKFGSSSAASVESIQAIRILWTKRTCAGTEQRPDRVGSNPGPAEIFLR